MLTPEIFHHSNFPIWIQAFLKHSSQFSRFIDKLLSETQLISNFNEYSKNTLFPAFFKELNKENLNSFIKSMYEIKGAKGFSTSQEEFIYFSKTPEFVELVRYLGTRPYSNPFFAPMIEPHVEKFIKWLKKYEPDASEGYLKSLNILAEGNVLIPDSPQRIVLSYEEVLANLPEGYIIGTTNKDEANPKVIESPNTCNTYLNK